MPAAKPKPGGKRAAAPPPPALAAVAAAAAAANSTKKSKKSGKDEAAAPAAAAGATAQDDKTKKAQAGKKKQKQKQQQQQQQPVPKTKRAAAPRAKAKPAAVVASRSSSDADDGATLTVAGVKKLFHFSATSRRAALRRRMLHMRLVRTQLLVASHSATAVAQEDDDHGGDDNITDGSFNLLRVINDEAATGDVLRRAVCRQLSDIDNPRFAGVEKIDGEDADLAWLGAPPARQREDFFEIAPLDSGVVQFLVSARSAVAAFPFYPSKLRVDDFVARTMLQKLPAISGSKSKNKNPGNAKGGGSKVAAAGAAAARAAAPTAADLAQQKKKLLKRLRRRRLRRLRNQIRRFSGPSLAHIFRRVAQRSWALNNNNAGDGNDGDGASLLLSGSAGGSEQAARLRADFLKASQMSGQRRENRPGAADDGNEQDDDEEDNVPLFRLKLQKDQESAAQFRTEWQGLLVDTIRRFGGASGTVTAFYNRTPNGGFSRIQPAELLIPPPPTSSSAAASKNQSSNGSSGSANKKPRPSTLALFDPVLASLRNTKHERLRVVERKIAGAYERAWRVREQALAQRRLAALRANDPEDYVRHLQTAKWSSLLSIMDRTHSLMLRIGAQLESKTDRGAAATAAAAAAATTSTAAAAASSNTKLSNSGNGDIRSEHLSVSESFRRFQAYVCSANDEYKLIHKNTVFVEQQPAAVRVPLFPHQLVGLRFLASLHGNNINGILADEMGVGKTLQTLSFFAHLREAGHARGMHLVIAPLSIVREWTESIAAMVPSLRCTVIGTEAEFNRIAADQQHLLLMQQQQQQNNTNKKNNNSSSSSEGGASTEGRFPFDVCFMALHKARNIGMTALQRIKWHFVVVDEAHKAVSNPATATARAINAMPFHNRLVLTGTPLNADVQELWSLLQFINPDIFCAGETQQTFDEVFRRPFAQITGGAGVPHAALQLEPEERDLVVMRLQQILKPFVLRRTKLDIDATLQMTYHRILCPLSALQVKLLALLRERNVVPILTLAEKRQQVSDSSSSSSSSSEEDDSSDDDDSSESGSDDDGESSASSTAASSPAAASQAASPDANGESSSDSETEPCKKKSGATKPPQRKLPQHGRAVFQHPTTATALQLAICNHPYMCDFLPQLMRRDAVPEPLEDDMALRSSGKLCVLDAMLQHLDAQGRKAVVFSHFLQTIDLLENHFISRGWGERFVSLTGTASVEERAAGVAQFRDDPRTFIFLLSMKAGGCGLNLQSADTVVLYDRDYTATNEEQALARVFRMGQKNVVRAVYLMTNDECERRVAGIAERKDRPRKQIIDGGTYRVQDNATSDDNSSANNNAGGGNDDKNKDDDDDDDDDDALLQDLGAAPADAGGDAAASNVDNGNDAKSKNNSDDVEEIDCSELSASLPQMLQRGVFSRFLARSVPRNAGAKQADAGDGTANAHPAVDESKIAVPFLNEGELPDVIQRAFAECEEDERNVREGRLHAGAGATRAAAAKFDAFARGHAEQPENFDVILRIMSDEDCDEEEALELWRARQNARRNRAEMAAAAARLRAEEADDPPLKMDAARVSTGNSSISNVNSSSTRGDGAQGETITTNLKQVRALLKPKTITLRGKQDAAALISVFRQQQQHQHRQQDRSAASNEGDDGNDDDAAAVPTSARRAAAK